MKTCDLCPKQVNTKDLNQTERKLIQECFWTHRSCATLKIWQSIIPKLSSHYPTQCEKLKAFLPKAEKIIQEQIEPNRKKMDKVLKSFFNKKGKVIPKFQDLDSWISPCEDCQQELKKEVNLAVDDIEKARIEEKIEKETQEIDGIYHSFSGEAQNDIEEWSREILSKHFDQDTHFLLP